MSSANLVSVTYTPETVYGEKPTPIASVVMETARFTSESLSGTPTTTESAALRQDRMSGGQVATGLEVGGSLDIELATGTFFDDFFAAGMMTTWVPQASQSETVTLIIDPVDDQKADLNVGDLTTIGPGVVNGDVIQLIPASGPPVVLQAINVLSATNVIVATKRGELGIVAQALDVAIPAHLVIGQIQPSFQISKTYTDVTHDVTTDEHSQTYGGSIVSGFTVSATYGEIVTGSFVTSGNGYLQEFPSYTQDVVTGGGTVNPAETSQPLNASIDVPLVTTSDAGVIEATTFCIESFSITMDSGVSPQNCIGLIAPTGFDLGRAAITIDATIYLSDTSYNAFMSGKLTQAPISMMFTMENETGGYAFALPAVQLNFPDPAATGVDEQTQIEAAGTAKVGPNGESALKIYSLVGVQ